MVTSPPHLKVRNPYITYFLKYKTTPEITYSTDYHPPPGILSRDIEIPSVATLVARDERGGLV